MVNHDGIIKTAKKEQCGCMLSSMPEESINAHEVSSNKTNEENQSHQNLDGCGRKDASIMIMTISKHTLQKW